MERIIIRGLAVRVHVGVTEKERRRRQTVHITVEVAPRAPYPGSDRLEDTVDYSSIRRDVQSLAGESRCALIETLAARIADHLMSGYPVRQVTVTVTKYPYRDADSVAYSCTRGGT